MGVFLWQHAEFPDGVFVRQQATVKGAVCRFFAFFGEILTAHFFLFYPALLTALLNVFFFFLHCLSASDAKQRSKHTRGNLSARISIPRPPRPVTRSLTAARRFA